MTPSPDVSVLMLAYGPEPYLHEAVAVVLASRDVALELILVDNGCTTDAVSTLAPDSRVHVLRPTANLGFTGGVNLAASGVAPSSRVIVLVNSDAIVESDALSELVGVLDADRTIGVAGACILLADDPTTVNSVGNPLHVLGLSWAGGLGDPAIDHAEITEVASASGACMAIDRRLWVELGGLAPDHFAYVEDLELCWRTWQHGRRVVYVPSARVVHHYEFSRSPLKMYLLERNRLLLVLTTYGRRMLVVLAPPLLAFDVALLAVAARQGWARQKLRGWLWILGHPGRIRRRRALVQNSRTVADRELVRHMTDVFDSAQMPMPPGGDLVQAALRAYWRWVRAWI
jgi:GT2 family glycosyltransferase